MADRERLDALLAGRGLFGSREKARAAIMSGCVYVDGQKADKPGTGFRADAAIEVRAKAVPYVSRGGLKLAKALREFCLDVSGLSVLDGGASTGGFTDCLLQNGASRVWAVDVGYGQLAWELRNDPRVVCIERMNIRHLTAEHLGGAAADMAVLDLSFISLSLVLPVIRGVLADGAAAVCLVKPQFEAGRDKVGKHGVVRSRDTHLAVLQGHVRSVREAGFQVKRFTFSPIKGPKGNIEFLSHLEAGGGPPLSEEEMDAAVEAAHRELL